MSAHHNDPFNVNYEPIHRMTTPMWKVWLNKRMAPVKKPMVQALIALYKRNFLLCTPFYDIIVRVEYRTSKIHELPFPWRKCPQHMIANKPEPEECPCANYYYPECGGPWRDMGRPDQHHPVCQHAKHAAAVFNAVTAIPITEQRPDEMERLRQSIENS